MEISKVTKISKRHQKSDTPKRLIITGVFEEKSMTMLEDKKVTLQKCYELLSFLKDFDDNKGRREMRQFENVNISLDV